jgi:AcrR family transcriptional regulator
MKGKISMQQRSTQTRMRILDAAQQLFSQEGYDATGVAEICKAAGVSKGAFYHHFPTKQAVFLEILNGWMAKIDAGFDQTRLETGSVPEALLQMASLVGGIFRSVDANLTIFLEFWNQAKRDPTVWQASIAPYRRFQNYFSFLIQEGITQGSLRSIDPVQGAHLLVSLALGVLMQALFDPQGADWGNEIQANVQLLLDGLARRAE